MQRTYHIVTLGCQMNVSDSERLRTVVEGLGFTWTDREDEANLLGVVACSVRQKAIDKVYSRIRKWNKWKQRRDLLTMVTGCILPSDHDNFLELFDLAFPMSDLELLPDMIARYGVHSGVSAQVRKPGVDMEGFWHLEPQYSSGFEAFVPIQNGCDKFCSFCAVPYTRGREVSRPSADIIAEVIKLVDNGYKSITLLGQNVNSYGLDKKGEEISFARLLEEVGELGHKSGKEFWVYFTSPHPRDMTDDVIDVIARYDCLAKQLHLPLQSGDDGVLERMNRNHDLDRYRSIVEEIQLKLPQATLFTDLIVGFTGETEVEFENTRKAMEEFRYNMAYIAAYSPRPGARSSKWEDDVPAEMKKQRFHTLTEELKKHAFIHNMKMVGRTFRVLVRDRDRKDGFLSGHTEGRIICRFASEDASLIGSFVDVRITSVTEFASEGTLMTETENITG